MKKTSKKKPIKRSIKTPKLSKNKKTLINFVLDETGSMIFCLEATINGFNEYVNGLKKRKEDIFFTLTQWDSTRFNVVYNTEPIKGVKELNQENYRPGASTPLYDAIGKTIRAIEKNNTKDMAVLCVIMTDGQENASLEYSLEDVKNLIKQKEKEGWTFVYLGANQDAWAVGQRFGLSKMNVMDYDTKKTKAAFSNLAVNTVAYCSTVTRAGGGGGHSCSNFFVDNSTYENAKEDNEILNKT